MHLIRCHNEMRKDGEIGQKIMVGPAKFFPSTLRGTTRVTSG